MASPAPPTLPLAPSVTGGPRVRESLEPARGAATRPRWVLLPGLGLLGGSRSKGSLERDGMDIFLT